MAGKIHREQVIERLSEQTGWTKVESANNLQAVLDTLADSIEENDRVTLTRFGTFDVRPTPARQVKVIAGESAGELRDVPPSHRIAFSPSKGLLDKVRGAR